LYTCLFANKSFDLRPFLSNESDELLKIKIQEIWQNREDRYSEIRHQLDGKRDKIEMYVIGG
jgi:cyclic pyranopterin phosphate synthase